MTEKDFEEIEYQKKMAEGMADGIEEYFKALNK